MPYSFVRKITGDILLPADVNDLQIAAEQLAKRTVLIAANDSPADVKAAASVTCDGTADDVEINAALASIPSTGGKVVLAPGTFNIAATLVIANISTYLEFDGAEVRWTTVTGTTPLLQVKVSKSVIFNPRLKGSGAKGNGTGILLVGDATGAHDVEIFSPEILNCDTAVEFGIIGSSSTGDCTIFGGALHDCKTGIKAKGFTNRAVGTRVYSCDINVDVTNDRVSAKFEGYGMVLNQWAQQAIRIRGGQGSVFYNTWLEHTNDALNPTEAILIGGSTGLGDAADREALGVVFGGTTKITLEDEQYAVRLVNARDTLIENLVISTNGTPPTSAVIRVDATCSGDNNRVRYIAFVPGSGGVQTFSPNAYPTILSNAGAAGSEVVIEQHPDVENRPVGTTIGGPSFPPNPAATYTVFRAENGAIAPTNITRSGNTVTVTVGSSHGLVAGDRFELRGATPTAYNGFWFVETAGGSTVTFRLNTGSAPTSPATTFGLLIPEKGITYFARQKNGHIASFAANTASQSGLRVVLEALSSHDVHFHFSEGRFHYLECPRGDEATAGVEDHASFSRWRGLSFTGEGRSKSTLSNRTNQTTASPDTEPLSFTNCQDVLIRDLGVESCGRYKSTTDAIDGDQACNFTIENVLVRSSRAKGIVLDGGDSGKWSLGNIIRNTHVRGRPVSCQADLLSGGSLTNGVTYKHAVAWRVKDLNAATITVASWSASAVTLTFGAAHGFMVGEEINVVGMTPSGYNGTFYVASVPTSTTLTYALASDPGTATVLGTCVGPATTKPGDPSKGSAATSTNKKVRVYLPTGPYTCTSRIIYRWDVTNGWREIATVYDNQTDTFDDDGTITGTSVTLTDHRSTIPDCGIQLLGNKGSLVEGCVVEGIGDAVRGSTQVGIDVSRKTSGVTTSDFNRIVANRVRQSASYGIRVVGGADNMVALNEVSNPGTVASKAQAIRFEGVTSYPTDRNTASLNVCRDDQDANSWSGGATTNNSIAINATGTPTDNRVLDNDLQGNTATAISDSGTTTVKRNNKGYVTEARGVVSVADGGTINHGLATTPTKYGATATTAGEFVSVTAVSSTQLTVSIKKHDGTAGTTANVAWWAEV